MLGRSAGLEKDRCTVRVSVAARLDESTLIVRVCTLSQGRVRREKLLERFEVTRGSGVERFLMKRGRLSGRNLASLAGRH